MKPSFYAYSKTLVALAVAVAAMTGAVSQAQPQPQPPSPAGTALPADIVPGSPLAEVVKLLQAGVEISTIKSYILNAQSAFNLDADKILYLTDAGAPSDLVNAMLDRDKTLYAATVTPPAASAAPAPTLAPAAPDTGTPTTPELASPPADMTLDAFNDTLAPYGSWVEVEGYGQCWQPTAVIYDPDWSPYCDRGHWVYTDYGWYWDSDYAWGVTFHYGRWFRSPQSGWCWSPDTVWAPSWVLWRSDAEYCGWAPLPPSAVFSPGLGILYRGASVKMDFDFGLGSDSFVFVTLDHVLDRHPRSFRVPQARVAQVFRQTTAINNFSLNHKTIVNRGFGVDRIASVTHHAIERVPVSTLPNAGRQGWRGEGFERTLRPAANYNSGGDNNAVRNVNTGSGQFRRGPETYNWQQNLQNQWPAGRSGGTTPNEGVQPRGAGQLPPKPMAPLEPPHPEAHPNIGEAQPRQYSPPPPAVAPQPRPGGNVPANGPNKQNQ